MKRLALLVVLAAGCGDASFRRIASVTTVEDSTTSTLTFEYQDDLLVAISGGAFEKFEYKDKRLDVASQSGIGIRYFWADGHVVGHGARYAESPDTVFDYDSGSLIKASLGGDQFLRYEYERDLLVREVTVGRNPPVTTTFHYAHDRLESVTAAVEDQSSSNYTYAYSGNALVSVSNGVAITYNDDGLIETVDEPTRQVTYTYAKGDFVGLEPIPHFFGGAHFNMSGQTRTQPEILLLDVAVGSPPYVFF